MAKWNVKFRDGSVPVQIEADEFVGAYDRDTHVGFYKKSETGQSNDKKMIAFFSMEVIQSIIRKEEWVNLTVEF